MAKKWFEVSETGSLKAFGYSPKKSASTRRRALSKAVKSKKHDGYEVWRKLHGLGNVTKRTQPLNSKKYLSDRDWVKSKFYDTKLW